VVEIAFLQRECGQRRHLGRKIIVARAFAADRRDRQNKIADGRAVFDAAAFAEEEARLSV